MTRKQFLITLFLAKLVFSFISWYVIGGMTKLGDTQSYLQGEFLHRNDWSSTAFIMSFLGHWFAGLVGYNVIANFPLMLLAFYGICLATRRLNLGRSEWFGLLVLLCLPSTLMWTSIHSKEAVLNFLLGAFALLLIKRLDGEAWRFSEKMVLAAVVALIAFFKPLYVAPVAWFLFYAAAYNSKFKKTNLTLAVVSVSSILFVFGVLSFKTEFASFLNVFHKNFSVSGELTRIGNVWGSVEDFFLSAADGMFIAYIGPTLAEAFQHTKLLPFFIEGLLSLFVIIYLIARSTFRGSRMYVHTFFMLTGGVVLFLLAQYPQGYFNPGSALRYKQSFQPFIFIILFYFAYGSSVVERPRRVDHEGSYVY